MFAFVFFSYPSVSFAGWNPLDPFGLHKKTICKTPKMKYVDPVGWALAGCKDSDPGAGGGGGGGGGTPPTIPPPPRVTVIVPNGGEKIPVGANYTIRWYTTSLPKAKTVGIGLRESVTGQIIGSASTTNTGSWPVVVPEYIGTYKLEGKNYTIVLCVGDSGAQECDAVDSSNGPFTIVPKVVPVPISATTTLEKLVTLEVSNETPGPFTPVSFKLVSYDIDLDRATTTWFVNGKGALSGVGRKTFATSTRDVGEPLHVLVTIQRGNDVITKEKTLIPSEVDILWEAIGSYAPPFYRGKALPGSEATIRAVAVPNIIVSGKKIATASAVYQWKLNDKFREFSNQSGFAKNTVQFVTGLFNDTEAVEVIASSFDTKAAARKKTAVDREDTKILLYEKHPLYGIQYENALINDVAIGTNEVSFVAEPYYFSSPDRETSLSYEWEVDGGRVAEGGEKQSEFVVAGAGAEGNFYVSVFAKHLSIILQYADGGVRVRTVGTGASSSAGGGAFYGQ